LRLLAISDIVSLKKAIDNEICGDYIYDYPPRQTYRVFTADVLSTVKESLESRNELNLYFHFPFCAQICTFCNLYTINDIRDSTFKRYFDVLFKELDYYIPFIHYKSVNTIYLGGGTPSWISPELFMNLFLKLENSFSIRIPEIEEVSLELSPETADPQKLREYRSIGINRVNVGVQSITETELSCIGRNYRSDTIYKSLNVIMNIGFKNVCVDLIYGLPDQTMDNWQLSLREVVSFQPETICTYPLTLRPHTGFYKKGYRDLSDSLQYDKYDYAKEYLVAFGYEQETHVRYKRSNSMGGYIQKENHWNLQNIIGFGAGARTYLWNINYRNGYSIIDRRKVYHNYIDNVSSHGYGIVDGIVLTQDEIMRKSIILGLNSLNVSSFYKMFQCTPDYYYNNELNMLYELGLLNYTGDYIKLTEKGIRHRDIVAQVFFSDFVRDLICKYDYAE
jgi:oxygen-independent coproporphyrinogen-3 oxidase